MWENVMLHCCDGCSISSRCYRSLSYTFCRYARVCVISQFQNACRICVCVLYFYDWRAMRELSAHARTRTCMCLRWGVKTSFLIWGLSIKMPVWCSQICGKNLWDKNKFCFGPREHGAHPPHRPQIEVCSSIFFNVSLIRKTQEDSIRNRKKGNLICSRSRVL